VFGVPSLQEAQKESDTPQNMLKNQNGRKFLGAELTNLRKFAEVKQKSL